MHQTFFRFTSQFYNIPCADMEQAEMEVILGLERVCCIESMEGERFVCTVELPMEQVVVRSRSERCLLEQQQQQQQSHSRGISLDFKFIWIENKLNSNFSFVIPFLNLSCGRMRDVHSDRIE